MQDIQILAEPERGFARSEFEQRLALTQSAMQESAMDAVLLTTEADIRYYSGFLTQFWQSPTRPWYLLLPQTGNPIAIIPSIGEPCMARTWISDIRIWCSPHPTDDGVSQLCEAITDCAGSKAVVGIQKGRETHLRMPLSDFEQIQRLLPACVWINASPLLLAQRQIKSEAEIEKISHACELASTAFELLPKFLTDGMSEIAVFRVFKQLCLQLGVDDTAYLVGGSGNNGYGDIISPASTRQVQFGDVLILDTGCVWDGYFCDFDRNYSVGIPSEQVVHAYGVVWDATQAGLEFIKPGVSCADVFHCMNQMMPNQLRGQSGAHVGSDADVGRLGHGLGMQLTETPSFAAFDNTVIQEGMVLTLEPGYTYAPGKMMVHEENIVIRHHGAQLLSRRAAQQITVIR